MTELQTPLQIQIKEMEKAYKKMAAEIYKLKLKEALAPIKEAARKVRKLYADKERTTPLETHKVEAWGMLPRTAKHLHGEFITQIPTFEHSYKYGHGNYRVVALIEGRWVRVYHLKGRPPRT